MIAALHELSQRRQWVAWAWEGEINPNTGKRKKVLKNPATGGNAMSNNPATWGTLADAQALVKRRRLAGVGFVFSPEDPYAGVDLDNCIDDAGEIAPWARSIIERLASYAEISPSGRGVKIYCRGTLPASLKTERIELYDQGRWFAVTGQHLAGTPETLGDAQTALDALYSQHKPAPPVLPAGRPTAALGPADERYPLAWVQAIANRVKATAADRVATASDGQKHNARLAAGELLGGYIAGLQAIGYGHLLGEDEAARLIYDSNPPAANQASEYKTIAGAVEHGMLAPVAIPAPPADQPRAAQPWAPPANSQVITVDQRYLEIPAVDTKVLMVKSAMGTGKTESLSGLIPADASVLIITHRVALGEQQAQRFSTDFYQDYAHDLAGRRRLVITLDSLDKLPLTPANTFEYVVIDESEQVLTHLAGKTIKPSRRSGVLATLAYFLTQARRVFYMDADLGMLTSNHAQRYHVAGEITTLVNTYRPGGRQFVAMPQKTDVLAMLERNVAAGQTAYVAINSRRQVHALALSLQNAQPSLRIMAISSENSTSPEIQHFIKEINSEIYHYDVVITSPSLGTGVSIDPAYFDAVYLIGEAKTNTAADLHQMAGRVRTIKSGMVYAWIAPQIGAEETDPAILRQYALQNYHDTGIYIDINPNTGALSSLNDKYLNLWADIHSARNASINTLAANFYAAAEAAGHTVVQGQPASEDDRAAQRAAQGEARAQLDAEWHRMVVTAPEITADQYSKLDAQRSTTPDERAAMLQCEIRRFYDEPVINITPELVAADAEGLREKVTRLAHVLNKDLALAADRKAEEDQHLIADRRNAAAARQLRVELLGYVVTGGHALFRNNDGSPVTVRADHPDLAAWLGVNKARIKRLLGLGVDPGKPETFARFVGTALGQLGLKQVKVKQDKATGQRFYALDMPTLVMMLTYADRYAARKRAELEQAAAGDAEDVAAGVAAIQALTQPAEPSASPTSPQSFTLTTAWQAIPTGACLVGNYDLQQIGGVWHARRLDPGPVPAALKGQTYAPRH